MERLENVKQFALAGNATFTVMNRETGNRFTFKVRRCDEKPDLSFVSVLNGPNNEEDFGYLGTIFGGEVYRHGRKSRIGEDAPSAKVFSWLFPKLISGTLPEKVEVFHEGRCGRCGRKLTVPESILSGFGPECASKM